MKNENIEIPFGNIPTGIRLRMFLAILMTFLGFKITVRFIKKSD